MNATCTSRSTPGAKRRTRHRYNEKSPAAGSVPINGFNAGLPPPSSSMKVCTAASPPKFAAASVSVALVSFFASDSLRAAAMASSRDMRTSRSRTENASPNQCSTAKTQSADASSRTTQVAGFLSTEAVTESFGEKAWSQPRRGVRKGARAS